MNISKIIYKIRIKMGLSTSEFCELLNVKVSTLWTWEKGIRHPKWRYIRQIVKLANENGMNLKHEDFAEKDLFDEDYANT